MTLRERRCLFTVLLAELVFWIRDQGWNVAYDEVTVHSPRKVRKAGVTFMAEDAVHKRAGTHPQGLGADLLLYLDLDGDGDEDDYVADGDHPAWRRIAAKWESLHPLATSGLRWNDANHVSLGEGSKSSPLP